MAETEYTLTQKYMITDGDDWQWLALPFATKIMFRLVWPLKPVASQKCELIYCYQKSYFLSIRDQIRNKKEPRVLELGEIPVKNRIYYYRWPFENVLLNLRLIIPEAEIDTEWAQAAIEKSIVLAQKPFNQKSPLPYCRAIGTKACKKLISAHMKNHT